jgi:hypothetical protein
LICLSQSHPDDQKKNDLTPEVLMKDKRKAYEEKLDAQLKTWRKHDS